MNKLKVFTLSVAIMMYVHHKCCCEYMDPNFLHRLNIFSIEDSSRGTNVRVIDSKSIQRGSITTLQERGYSESVIDDFEKKCNSMRDYNDCLIKIISMIVNRNSAKNFITVKKDFMDELQVAIRNEKKRDVLLSFAISYLFRKTINPKFRLLLFGANFKNHFYDTSFGCYTVPENQQVILNDKENNDKLAIILRPRHSRFFTEDEQTVVDRTQHNRNDIVNLTFVNNFLTFGDVMLHEFGHAIRIMLGIFFGMSNFEELIKSKTMQRIAFPLLKMTEKELQAKEDEQSAILYKIKNYLNTSFVKISMIGRNLQKILPNNFIKTDRETQQAIELLNERLFSLSPGRVLKNLAFLTWINPDEIMQVLGIVDIGGVTYVNSNSDFAIRAHNMLPFRIIYSSFSMEFIYRFKSILKLLLPRYKDLDLIFRLHGC